MLGSSGLGSNKHYPSPGTSSRSENQTDFSNLATLYRREDRR